MNLLRAIMFLAACVVAVLIYAIFAQAVVDLQPAVEAGRTARALAAQETRQIQAQEWNATLRSLGQAGTIVAVAVAAAAVLLVAAVQAGRTLRHRESERTRRVALLSAYVAVREPLAAEREAWPLMLRAAALRFWLSRLGDWHLPRPAALLQPKDPGHFERVLRARIAQPWHAVA